MSLYDSVRDLPLEIEGYRLTGQEVEVSFLRKTTTVTLVGAGEEGSGEDVTYEAGEHDALQARGADLPLAGTWTLDSFSQHLAGLPLFTAEPDQAAYLDYRRWAFESAALDLALRQGGTSLGEPLSDTSPRRCDSSCRCASGNRRPPSGSGSGSFSTPHSTSSSTPRRHGRPSSSPSSPSSVASMRSTSRASTTAPRSTALPTRTLYRRVIAGLPSAWLEDPQLTPETVELLEPVAERVTWDAPIHSVADILALRWAPRSVNVKPSRFGSVERLFAAYDHCAVHEIAAYGGGQYELGIGRDQIQLLASLFHPSTSNDVAPSAYNLGPTSGLPRSPLALTPRATGFAVG